MSIEIQKYYRFILPGAILVASDCLIILEKTGFHINEFNEANSFILFLGLLAIILGVPLYWIYIVLWHFIFGERKRMQSEEVKWLDSNIDLIDEHIYNYSNIIWHHLDANKKHEFLSVWLRNNFLLVHSLGCSVFALFIGFIIYLSVKRCIFFKESESLIWIIWIFLFFFLLKYRSELMKRYKKRLEIFIKLNSDQIMKDVNEYDPKDKRISS